MDQEAYRHVPYDIDTEQALLGAIFVDDKAFERVEGLLRADDFYDAMHARVFQTMLRIWERGMTITPITLHAAMKGDPGLAEVGGLGYLTGLAAAAPAIPNVRDLARVLREHAVRRGLIRVGEDIVNAAHEAPVEQTPQDQIEEAEKALYRIGEASRYGAGPIEFAESLRRAVEAAERAQLRGGKISGVPTGFTRIDSLLGGLQASDLVIIAGRPGMGKTALATNIAFHAARMYAQEVEVGEEQPRGAPVLFFSLEMAAQQLAARLLSQQTTIEMWKIRNGKFDDEEWSSFVLTNQALAVTPLYIDDTGGISIAQIAARARRMKREKNIGLVVIDYLQLIEPARRIESRVQEVTEITKGLKTLAKELNVPVLALSQLSRGVESRDDKRPMLSDLRESGSIEQDADVVMFVYREEYYLKTREPADKSSSEWTKWHEKSEKAKGLADVLVEKHRHGPTGKITLQFEERFTQFNNLADDSEIAARQA